MKNEIFLNIWMLLSIFFIACLLIWAIFFVDEIENRIPILGIVGAIVAAITSVVTVTINNKKTKERELELVVFKEKQKVFEHYYNAYFEILKNVKKGKSSALSTKIESEMMEFKRGLMNWGSEELIKSYLIYDSKLLNSQKSGSDFDVIKDGDKFLKDLRREIGFMDSDEINIMSIILNSEAREELQLNTK